MATMAGGVACQEQTNAAIDPTISSTLRNTNIGRVDKGLFQGRLIRDGFLECNTDGRTIQDTAIIRLPDNST